MLSSILKSGKPSVSGFVKGIPKDLLDTLKSDEQEAGQFVCAVLHGDIPGAIADLAEDIFDEIEGDFNDVTSLIKSLPTLAPEILEDILQDGEDVVSVIGELFTNPEAALEVIEGEAETIVSDVESWGKGVLHGLQCIFFDCPTATSTSTTKDPAATLQSSCSSIMAAVSTTLTTTEKWSAASTTYSSAQPTFAVTLPVAKHTGIVLHAAVLPSND